MLNSTIKTFKAVTFFSLNTHFFSFFQSTVAVQTRLPWAVRRKGGPQHLGGIPEGALDPQVTHRWSGENVAR